MAQSLPKPGRNREAHSVRGLLSTLRPIAFEQATRRSGLSDLLDPASGSRFLIGFGAAFDRNSDDKRRARALLCLEGDGSSVFVNHD
jgi:hypothetical protein